MAEVKDLVSLKAYADAHLQHLPGGKYACPVCGSGTGENRTPAFSVTPDDRRWTCFACMHGGDVFDLAGAVEKTEDRAEQLRAVCEWAGIEVTGAGGHARGTHRLNVDDIVSEHDRGAETSDPASEMARFSPTMRRMVAQRSEAEYIDRCARAMTDGCEGMAYLMGRGFSPEFVRAHRIGWDEVRRRVVLPWSARRGEFYHVDRDVTGEAKAKYLKPRADDVGPQPVQNSDAVCGSIAIDPASPRPAETLFVVEGMLDALAIEACGGRAMALCGLAWRDALALMSKNGWGGVAVAATDNDEAGDRARAEFIDAAREVGVMATAPVSKLPTKDACEALEKDRPSLEAWVSECTEGAGRFLEGERTLRYLSSMKALRLSDPADALTDIHEMSGRGFEAPIPTGLAGIDAALDGGLRPELHIVGAVSSLGKTTLAVQIADAIAEGGRGVLFVTIEQSAREIVAKSLSRMMREAGHTVTTRALTSAERRAGWDSETREAFEAACARYMAGAADRLRIMEGTTQPSVEDVAKAAQAIADYDGEPPVVFIDYLQLLAPQGERDTDKQATDKNVMSLRQMVRDMRAPVFLISSLNRASYSGSISMDSFKESGAIEYGADVLLGLQPWGVADRVRGLNDQKAKAEASEALFENKTSDERRCEIVVLKQRGGAMPPKGIPLTFFPKSSMFVDGVIGSSSRIL